MEKLNCWNLWQIAHFILSTSVVTLWLVEFALPPPLYDSFPTDDRYRHLPTPDQVFQKISPLGVSEDGIHRIMDTPILSTILVYYFGCFYFRFRRKSWLMTLVAYTVVLVFCIVHYAAPSYFDWKYLGPRVVGIALEIAVMTLLSTISITFIQADRQRLKFRLVRDHTGNQTTLTKATLAWNIMCNYILYFICLTMWTSVSYQSFVFIRSKQDMIYLCQVTTDVICTPCQDTTPEALVECKAQNRTASCATEGMTAGFCLFNYTLGYFTFVRVFAYAGGLFFVWRNFINAMTHYACISRRLVLQWWNSNGKVQLQRLHMDSLPSLAGSLSRSSVQRERLRLLASSGVDSSPCSSDCEDADSSLLLRAELDSVHNEPYPTLIDV
ncbi:uncharacterized protein LOC135826408 [Sycon ciliatum]|uniref:uncharacterized protein LOC135826408 n=1 Tax=Sycon ciliatum TaxID=27933 RepID=UPI0031F622DD